MKHQTHCKQSLFADAQVRRVFLWGLACAAAPLLVFLGTLGGAFVSWDDPEIFLRNPLIEGLDARHLREMFASLYMTTYQPLAWLVYAVLRRGWGAAPASYHAATWLFHAANCVLLYSVGLRLLDAARPGFRLRPFGPAAAAAGALLWGLHPLFAQSVAWASQLSDLMASFLALWALRCYLEEGFPAAAGAWLFFVASLLCRWKAVGLPAVLLALDVYPLKRLQVRPWRVFWTQGLFLLPALAAVWINAKAKSAVGFAQVAARPYEVCVGILFYLKQFLWPSGLVPLYPIDGQRNPLGLSFWTAAFLVLGLSALLVARWRRWPAGPVLWLSYLVAVLPPLALSKEGPVFAMDIYAYLGLMGVCPLFAWLLERGLSSGRVPPRALGAAVAVLLSWLAVLSAAQSRVWRDSISLWTHAIEADPRAYVAHLNLSAAYYEEGRVEEAILELKEHLLIHPTDDLAQRSLANILRLHPRTGSHPAQVLNNKAVDLCQRGRCGEAVPLIEKALSLEPDSVEIRRNYVRALRGAGRAEDARRVVHPK